MSIDPNGQLLSADNRGDSTVSLLAIRLSADGRAYRPRPLRRSSAMAPLPSPTEGKRVRHCGPGGECVAMTAANRVLSAITSRWGVSHRGFYE